MGVDPQTEPLTIEEATPLLSAAFERREVAFERMLLIGPPRVSDSARSWVRAVYEMRDSLNRGDQLTQEHWRELVRLANAARAEFHQVAQADLGVQFTIPR